MPIVVRLSEIGFLIHGDDIAVASYDAPTETFIYGSGGMAISREDVIKVSSEWCLIPSKLQTFYVDSDIKFILAGYDDGGDEPE